MQLCTVEVIGLYFDHMETEREDMLNKNISQAQWFNHVNPQVPGLKGFCGTDTWWIIKCLKLSPLVKLCQMSNKSQILLIFCFSLCRIRLESLSLVLQMKGYSNYPHSILNIA